MKNIIWVIEDNEVDQLILCKMLESCLPNISVHCYSTAVEALRVFMAERPAISLILLDLDLPVMTGWDFIDEFSKLSLSIPLYVVSSYWDEDKIKTEKNQLVKGFFCKPLTEKNVLEIAQANHLLTL